MKRRVNVLLPSKSKTSHDAAPPPTYAMVPPTPTTSIRTIDALGGRVRLGFVNNMSQQEEHEVLPALARFVGATIRDKVVLDQLEEINALKSQLEATRRVEITGPGGHPVYASGSFALGDFDDDAHDEDGNVGTVWSVGLTTFSDRKTRDPAIPMHQMSNIEIRIGGVLYATSEDVDGTRIALGIRRGNPFDWCRPDGSRRKGAMHRSVVCQFGLPF
jgi:hypothetical protein